MGNVEDDEREDIVSRDKSWLTVKVRIGMGRVRMIQIEGQEVNKGTPTVSGSTYTTSRSITSGGAT